MFDFFLTFHKLSSCLLSDCLLGQCFPGDLSGLRQMIIYFCADRIIATTSTIIFLFCFPLKEEFRELREQPSDPQAEQELINSIEQVYFSTDSFDIVKYELEVKKNSLKPI